MDDRSFTDTTFGKIVILEGLISINAGLATLDPEIYGGMGVLLFPLLGAEGMREHPTRTWVGLAAAEALALYNINELDKDENSSGDIFRRNVIGWHLFLGVLASTHLLSRTSLAESVTVLHYTPVPGGGVLGIKLHF